MKGRSYWYFQVLSETLLLAFSRMTLRGCKHSLARLKIFIRFVLSFANRQIRLKRFFYGCGRESLLIGRNNTFDLLVLTIMDQLLLLPNICVCVCLNEEVNGTDLPLQ
jgi:hypothetical protein